MATRTNKDLEVFISHSHKDKKAAEALVHFLTIGAGIDSDEIRCTSYHPTGLTLGSPIANDLRKDIEKCSYFLPLVTPNTSGSEYVAFETGAAWALEIPIMPLIYGFESPAMPALLQGLVYCDLADLDSLVKLASELSDAIFYAKHRPSPSQMLSAGRMFLATLLPSNPSLKPT